MITIIIFIGTLAILITALVKEISATMRGLVCWSFSSIASVASLLVYFSEAEGYKPELSSVFNGLAGFAVVVACVLLIELFSPAKRFRKGERKEYDRDKAEDSLNIVMMIVASSAAVSVVCCEFFGEIQFSILAIIPLAAVSIRQLSYFMHRVKMDTIRADAIVVKRARLIKSLDSGKRSL